MKKRPVPALRMTPKTKDLPATQAMLGLVRDELKADTRELRSEMKSEFKTVDARFDRVDAKLERMAAEVSRIGMLMEEQNSRNQIVLEGLTAYIQRQERVETRIEDVERTVRSIARVRS